MMIVHHFPVSFGLIPDQLIMMNIMPHFHEGRAQKCTIQTSQFEIFFLLKQAQGQN